MKFFHLSDLHIGLKLMNRDLKEDQEYVLGQIIHLAKQEQPDGIVIAGDIYDKAVPSAEAVELFDWFLNGLTGAVPDADVMLISGNHDSAARINCFRSVLSRQKVHMIGQPPRTGGEHIEKVVRKDRFGTVNFYLLPFVRPSMVRQAVDAEENKSLSYDEAIRRLLAREMVEQTCRNVLVSHQFYLPSGKPAEEVERSDSEIWTVGNIDQVSAEVLEPFDYAALGHIHKPMKVRGEFCRYCGTPLACSVSEAGQEKAVLLVEMKEKGNLSVKALPLKPLRQVRVIRGELLQVLKQSCEDYVTVILTDRADLDILDMQDRLRHAFPYLLEIRRETQEKANFGAESLPQVSLSPFQLCCEFLKDADENEKEILQEVINTVLEEELE